MQHEKDQAVATAQDHTIVLDPLPSHVAHLVRLLIGYSWPGGWLCHVEGGGVSNQTGGEEHAYVYVRAYVVYVCSLCACLMCMRVCVRACVRMCACMRV